MKSIFKLISLGLSILLLSSCYQKARAPQPDDGSGVSNYSKWDWNGEAPLSFYMDGVYHKLNDAKVTILGMNNPIPLLNTIITEKNFDPTNYYTYHIAVNPKLTVGTHIITPIDNVQFTFMTSHTHTVGQFPTSHTINKFVVKVLRNDDQILEGYFYGNLLLGNAQTDNGTRAKVEKGYFKLDKTTIQWVN